MPLSFGIPLGLVLAFAGAVVYFATRHKRTARYIIWIGMTIFLLTVLVILLTVNSGM